MFMPVLSGLIVSVDAFFIGLSLGLQKNCKFMYLAIINGFLLGLCMLGFLLAGRVYEYIGVDTDVVVGFLFIGLGVWYILHYFASEYIKPRRTIILVGLVMSVEAMLITMGITFIFSPGATVFIPVTVALAHFAYSAVSFHLARTRRARQISPVVSHVVSGAVLIIYGLMALFVEIGI